jgi:hypothetical protein
MPDLPAVGDDFAGYRMLGVLGRGRTSVVYQAGNPRLGNIIALKVLVPQFAADDVFRTRFFEESRIAASMNHPNVIPIHDMGDSDGLLYIAMRHVAGTDLRQLLVKEGRLAPADAVFLLTQVARALDAAHRRGLVHRDVKPGNLLVEHQNEDPDHVYLTDFGITKVVTSRTGLTSPGEFLGTVDYIAPEQIRGISVLGMADQYSLGCVLYECLTGRVPFEKDLDAAIIWAHVEEPPVPPSAACPGLPRELDYVFERVLAKQPGDRYGSCREFMEAAGDALGVTLGLGDSSAWPVVSAPAVSAPAADEPAVNWTSGLTPLSAPPGIEMTHGDGAGDWPPAPAMTDGGGESPWPQAPPRAPVEFEDPVLQAPAFQEAASAQPAFEQAAFPQPAFEQPAFVWPQPGDGEPAFDRPQPGDGEPDVPGAAVPGAAGGGPGTHREFWERPVPRRRPRWPAAAAAAALIAAGGGAWALTSGGSPAHGHAGTTSPSVRPMAMPAQAAPTTRNTSMSPMAMRTSAPASPTAMPATGRSPLMTALIQANSVTGKVPPSRCTQQGTARVTCTSPAPGVTGAAFQTFPSLTALYAAYQQAIKSVDGGRGLQNVQDCGLAAPPAAGAEVGWNHEFVHPRNYTIARMAAGRVTVAQAAGRVFCMTNASTGEATFIWTQDVGHVLGWVTGPLHEQVWDWWAAVHHEISIGAPPMRMPSM